MQTQEARAPRWVAHASQSCAATALVLIGSLLLPSASQADWIPTPGAVYIVDEEYVKNENQASFVVTIRRDGGSAGGDCVQYMIEPYVKDPADPIDYPPATAGDDYQYPSGYSTGWVCWGDLDSDDKTVVVPIVNDNWYESEEYFQIRLINTEGDGPPDIGELYNKARLKIVDNESSPTISIVVLASQPVAEPEDEPTEVPVRFLLTPPSSFPVTVELETTGTASGDGVDYRVDLDGDVFFEPGINQVYRYFTILPDFLADGETGEQTSETIIITMESANGAALGSPDERTITITDSGRTLPYEDLRLWLKADEPSSLVTSTNEGVEKVDQWRDQSWHLDELDERVYNENHAIGSSTTRPFVVESSIGGLPAVRFQRPNSTQATGLRLTHLSPFAPRKPLFSPLLAS